MEESIESKLYDLNFGFMFSQPKTGKDVVTQKESERKNVMDKLRKQTTVKLEENLSIIHTLRHEYNEKRKSLEKTLSENGYFYRRQNVKSLSDELEEYDFVLFILFSLQISLECYEEVLSEKMTDTHDMKTTEKETQNKYIDILIQIDDEKLLEREIKLLLLPEIEKINYNPMHMNSILSEFNNVRNILEEKIQQSYDEKIKEKYRFILNTMNKNVKYLSSGGKSRRRRRRRVPRRRRTQRR
jgi:hypothetical protein